MGYMTAILVIIHFLTQPSYAWTQAELGNNMISLNHINQDNNDELKVQWVLFCCQLQTQAKAQSLTLLSLWNNKNNNKNKNPNQIFRMGWHQRSEIW